MKTDLVSNPTRVGDYYGLSTRVIETEQLRVEFLTETGPRIVRLQLAGSTENIFAETPNVSWETKDGRYFVRGGHRLWRSPESELSSIPDNNPVKVIALSDGVTLQQAPEHTGLGKRMTIQLLPEKYSLRITHEMTNEGETPFEIAPWAITQLPLGGVALLPQPLSRHGDLLPNRHLVLWQYSSWRDSRLHLYDDYLLIKADAKQPPLKIGYLNDCGWIAYWRAGMLFVKRFMPHLHQLHPDRNCNVEVYCNDVMLELETVAPLQMLLPGQTTTHVEQWDIYCDVPPLRTLEEARIAITSLALQSLAGT